MATAISISASIKSICTRSDLLSAVCQYLPVRDIALLDSAVAEKRLRVAFLDALASIGISFQVDKIDELKWLFIKGVQVTNILVNADYLEREFCDASVMALAFAPVLEKLTFDSYCTGSLLLRMLRSSPNLKDLTLTSPEKRHYEIIGECSSLCVLRSLTLIEYGENEPKRGTFIELISKCKHLRKLSVDDSYFGIDDKLLGIIAKELKQLEELSLYTHKSITDAGLLLLSDNCRGIRSLCLFSCDRISIAGLNAFASTCCKLEELSLHIDRDGSSYADIIAVLEKCPKLHTLQMQGFRCETLSCGESKVSDNRFINLKSLDISFSSMPTETLMKLLRSCPCIKSVSVDDHNNITDDDLSAIIDCCPKLTSLNISGTGLTDRGMLSIASSLPDLLSLSVERIDTITKAGISCISIGCRKLRKLDTSMSLNMTSKEINALFPLIITPE